MADIEGKRWVVLTKDEVLSRYGQPLQTQTDFSQEFEIAKLATNRVYQIEDPEDFCDISYRLFGKSFINPDQN